MLKKILESDFFGRFILILIIINSIVLGLDTSVELKTKFGNILTLIDNVCLIIFTLELVLRIIVYRLNFFIGKDRNWNWFDLIIVTISLLATSNLSVLRAFRVLRALKVLSAIPTMRIVLASLLNTLPSLGSIGFLLMVFYYVYGVLCVNLFGEKFPQWFGTLGKSFYTLFQIMTLESWSMGIVRPVMEVYPYAWIVFVSFILIASFGVLNLIIGVIVESIAEMKAKRGIGTDTED